MVLDVSTVDRLKPYRFGPRSASPNLLDAPEKVDPVTA